MTATTVEQLVNDYLTRLEAAAADLPDNRRTELVAEIGEHIEAARTEGVAADEVTTRTMLDQLGEPAEIAAAARAELDDSHRAPTPPPATVTAKPGTGVELAAVLLLTIGSFIPLIGWAVGVVLLWTSQRWTIREKLLGTLVVPGGPGGLLYSSFALAVTSSRVCTTTETSNGEFIETCSGTYIPPWVTLPVFILGLIAPFIVAGVLYSRARTRADAEPSVRRPAGELSAPGSPWGGAEIATVALLGASVLIMMFGVAAAVVVPTGLAFLWAATHWTRREKWIGSAIILAALAATVPIIVLGYLPLFHIFLAVGPVAAAVYLAITLTQHQPAPDA